MKTVVGTGCYRTYTVEEIRDYAKCDLEDLIEKLKSGQSNYVTGDAEIPMDDLLDVLYYLEKQKHNAKFSHYLVTEFLDNPKENLEYLIRLLARGNYADDNHDFVYVSYDLLKDALGYLNMLKLKMEPPLGKKPDYVPLSFHELAEMIGEPVYVKETGQKGRWKIVNGVRKNEQNEFVGFHGDNTWNVLKLYKIYRTKEGAENDNC